MISEFILEDFKLTSGQNVFVKTTYQLFGKALGTAPVVLVNHALTGNSNVAGPKGWWSEIVGDYKVIDTKEYTVLSIDIPGNGYSKNSSFSISNYKDWQLIDVAKIQVKILENLAINNLFAVIGGSLGGQLAWELLSLNALKISHVVPIATDWKATDWLLANCKIQDSILNNSKNPIHDARLHAMTLYRTPNSFKQKFERRKNSTASTYKVEDWLLHHGNLLQERFQLSSYKLMNHLLTTTNVLRNYDSLKDLAKNISADIHLVSVDSDLFFLAEDIWETYIDLCTEKDNIFISEIKSIHGHDAFLIETAQLQNILKPIFEIQTHEHNNKHHLVWNR
jgi:homoserine O-acetyltransferase